MTNFMYQLYTDFHNKNNFDIFIAKFLTINILKLPLI